MNHILKRYSMLMIFFLAALAYFGNVISLPLFYGIDFIFGSIAVIFAAITYGRLAAVFVALIGGIYTYFLWGHPYATFIFAAEAFWVASFAKKDINRVVLIDALYWLFLGIPFALFIYTQVLNLNVESASLIGLKQMLNGIFNALIGHFLYFTFHVYLKHKIKISIQSLLFNLILFVALIAGSIPVIISSHQTSRHDEQQIYAELQRYNNLIYQTLLINYKNNKNETKLIETFKNIPTDKDKSAILIDKKNNVISTLGKSITFPLPANSEIITQHKNIKIWLPSKKLPILQRWEKGYFIHTKKIQNIPFLGGIIIEQRAKSIIHKLNIVKRELFIILGLLMIIAIIISLILSRWLTKSINLLDSESRKLIENITKGKMIALPASSISEFSNLAVTLDQMANEISQLYQNIRNEKSELASIVDIKNATLHRVSMVASRTTNCVVVTDTEGKIEWTNTAFTKLTGYEPAEIIGKKPGEFLQGARTNVHTVREMSEKIKNVQRFSEEIIYYTKQGEEFWLHIDCNPIFDNAKHSGFIAIESDITQRKIAQEELIKQTAQLNAVLNAATEFSIITTDVDGLITMFNSGAEKMLGYSASELVNKSSPAIFHLESEVLLRSHELTQTFGHDISGFDVFVTIPNIEGSETREWTYIKKDGTHLIVLLSVTQVTTNDKTHVGYLGVAQDITERKRLDTMKKEFVSTVSHELRTPLTSINGTLGLLQGGAVGEISEQASDMLSVAINNTQRLTHLINDLLDMEKVASGKMNFDIQTLDILPLLDQAIVMNASYAEQYNVTYKLESHCDEARVEVDSNRFLQIMANFMSNAAKFSHSGDQVDITLECHGDTVKVSVKDYGIGIDSNFFDKIFNRFSQVDSSDTRSKGGTGLGLAITQELAKIMHTKVDFHSTKNQGSVFWIELPRK